MNPFDDDHGIERLERRLGVLMSRFRSLADGMSDLPLYNHAVGVEAVDFLPFGDTGFGVLVTPWFMSAVFLPLDPMPFAPDRVGRTRTVPLPAGERVFQLGGDEVLGLLWTHSLLSPLDGIGSHEAAVERARTELVQLLTLPEPETPARVASRRTIFTGPVQKVATARAATM